MGLASWFPLSSLHVLQRSLCLVPLSQSASKRPGLKASRCLFPPSIQTWWSVLIPSFLYPCSNTQFSLKKILPIKKNDAEMLTRQDIQFDLLDCIFKDETKAFTDQRSGNASKKLCFKDLYISALFQSSKCSKVLKDKMKETPAFAIELAKISLLANVGRINTTMACAWYLLFYCIVLTMIGQSSPRCVQPCEHTTQCLRCRKQTVIYRTPLE